MKTLTLKDWDCPYESPEEIQVESHKELTDIVNHWMTGKPDGRIFVCFDTWVMPDSDHTVNFNVTTVRERIGAYLQECRYNMIQFPNHKIKFNIYEFVIWEEAFIFCSDLQEEL